MDKATVALAATEDNAAAIARLQKALAKKAGCRALTGELDGRFSKLGEVRSDGTTAIIAAVPSNAQCTVYLNGVALRKDRTPLFTIIPAGSGEITVQPPVAGVYAIIIGEP